MVLCVYGLVTQMSSLSSRKAEIAPGQLLTLVVPDSEVGVVSSLRSQAVVEMLTVVRVILIHGTHCLDELKEDTSSG